MAGEFANAQVKFLSDGDCERPNVPTSHFKVVFLGLMRPSELSIGSVYQVFWSPEPEETPADVMESCNEILDIDDLPAIERDRKKRQGGGPLKGFYNALLLSLSQSEGSSKELKRELSDSNCLPPNTKRPRVPSERALEGMKVASKPITCETSRSKKKNLKEAAVEATKRNLSGLFAMCSTTKSDSNKRKKTSKKASKKHAKNDSDAKVEVGKALDIEVEPKGSKNEMHAKKEKEMEVKEKKRDDVEDAEYWKQKFLALSENVKDSTAKTSEIKFPLESSTHLDFDAEGVCDIDPMDNAAGDNNAGNSFFGGLDDGEKGSGSEYSNKKSGQGSGSSSNSDSSSNDEDEEHVAKRTKVIPAGQGGDSQALFNYADKLWQPHIIVKRSPTGLAAASKNKAVGYPKMTPLKVKQCEEFLKKRAEAENASKEETELRVRRTRYILGQRIMSIRKSFRRQKIEFPTAEEAQEEKKREKKALKEKKREKSQ